MIATPFRSRFGPPDLRWCQVGLALVERGLHPHDGPHAERDLGGKLMWNQTPPVLIHVHRPDVVSQAVSFWRAVQTRVWRGRPDPRRDSAAEYHAGAIAMSSRC